MKRQPKILLCLFPGHHSVVDVFKHFEAGVYIFFNALNENRTCPPTWKRLREV